jgi:hypothetical protein
MRALKSEIGCLFLGVWDWMIVWLKYRNGKKLPEVFCVVGWVWGMVKTNFFQLGKCSKSFVNASIVLDSTRMSIASFVSKISTISKLNLVCHIISIIITNFFISTIIMLSLTIYLALLCQNIESNPGPHRPGTTTLPIMTYNCNGLGDQKKLKRLLLKLNVLVNKGCIVFLQETHIVDTKYLEMIW